MEKLKLTPVKKLPELNTIIGSCHNENFEYDTFMKSWDKKYDKIYGQENKTKDLTPIKPVKTSFRATLKYLKLQKVK